MEGSECTGSLSGLLQVLGAAHRNSWEGWQRSSVHGVLLWRLDNLEGSEAVLVRPGEDHVRPGASGGWGAKRPGWRQRSRFLDLTQRERLYLSRKLLDEALLLGAESCWGPSSLRSDLRSERLLRLGLPKDSGLWLRLLPKDSGLWLRLLPKDWRLWLRLLPKDWRLGLRLLPKDWRLGLGFPKYRGLAGLLSENRGLSNWSWLPRCRLLRGGDGSESLVAGKSRTDHSALSINSLGTLRVHWHRVVADNA